MPIDQRPLRTAELLSVGSELLTGATQDTNAGEIARALSDLGVSVRRIVSVPDELDAVRDGFAEALSRADLVISTGGLGPTPDDLTREAIAALAGETPRVDPTLETWLRGLWARRGMPFPELNLKQAWLIPSAAALDNSQGTAPGWWVERDDGRVVVALPGPPREMRSMWQAEVLPRLSARDVGSQTETRTYRLAGIGESQVADLLGDDLLRSTNPIIATYARAEAVDVRVSATADAGASDGPSRSAHEVLVPAEATVLAAVGEYVWSTGTTTWAEAIDAALEDRGWTLATVEVGTRGALAALLGEMNGLRFAEVLAASDALPAADGETADGKAVEDLAERVRTAGGTAVGLAARISDRGGDTAVSVAVASPEGIHRERRLVFLGGRQGRTRAAVTAASILLGHARRSSGGGVEAALAGATSPPSTSLRTR